MISVKLHGPLAKGYPDAIFINTNSPADAIDAVSRQVSSLKPTAAGYKTIQVVGYDTVESLNTPVTEPTTLNVMPAISLSSGSTTRIIIGVVLVTVAVFMGGVFWPAIIGSAGMSLIMGGVMELLAPQQKLSKEEEAMSKYLGSPPNTVGIGTRIPILYGKDLVQGHILSSDIDAAEVA